MDRGFYDVVAICVSQDLLEIDCRFQCVTLSTIDDFDTTEVDLGEVGFRDVVGGLEPVLGEYSAAPVVFVGTADFYVSS